MNKFENRDYKVIVDGARQTWKKLNEVAVLVS